MSDIRTIIDSIREIAEAGNTFGVMCTVKSVDSTNKLCICTPVDDSADLLDIKLMASNDNGFYVLPKVDSFVIVSLTSTSTGFISMFSTVDEIQLNGDNFDGIVKVNELVTKISNLEKDINDLKTVFSTSWIPVPNDGGAALKASTATWSGAPLLPLTVKADLENTTVKNGDGS